MRARSYFHPPLPVYDVGTTTVARRLFIGKRPPRRCLQLGCFMGLFRDTRPLKARPRTTTLLVLHRLSLIIQISTMYYIDGKSRHGQYYLHTWHRRVGLVGSSREQKRCLDRWPFVSQLVAVLGRQSLQGLHELQVAFFTTRSANTEWYANGGYGTNPTLKLQVQQY